MHYHHFCRYIFSSIVILICLAINNYANDDEAGEQNGLHITWVLLLSTYLWVCLFFLHWLLAHCLQFWMTVNDCSCQWCQCEELLFSVYSSLIRLYSETSSEKTSETFFHNLHLVITTSSLQSLRLPSQPLHETCPLDLHSTLNLICLGKTSSSTISRVSLRSLN